jgi:hypothetical protein
MATDYTKTRPDPDREDVRDRDTNPDPITGAPGSHPVGTGVGAAGGATAGALAGAAIGGAVGGPVGAPIGGMIGGIAGAVGGGAAGHAVAESVDPTVENDYWAKNYSSRPYYESGMTYDDYAPAYQHGWESRTRYQGREFDEVEPELRSDWERNKARSRLGWDRAKLAARDAWNRVSDKVERAVPGDSDRDGK